MCKTVKGPIQFKRRTTRVTLVRNKRRKLIRFYVVTLWGNYYKYIVKRYQDCRTQPRLYPKNLTNQVF